MHIDSHLHLWNPHLLRYPWLDNVPSLAKPFLPEDLLEAGVGMEDCAFVFVECDAHSEDYLKEAEWVSGLAEKGFPIVGIVAGYSAEKGADNEGYLKKLQELPLVKGVRRQYALSHDFCLSENFLEGVRLASDYGYSFDLCFDYTQFQETIALVKACPMVNFIIDHLAKPGIKYGLMDDWKRQMTSLAEAGVRYVKLSGLLTESFEKQHTEEIFFPYFDHALEIFGGEGILFGSDWPVVTVNGSYKKWKSLMETWANDRLDSTGKTLFWGENARKAYGLTT